MYFQAEEDLSCPICHEIFKDPVVLSCSHSFCKGCLEKWWREKEIKDCPVCKARHLLNDPTCNLALKNLCETFLRERDQRASSGSEPLCSLHKEKLRLFCLDHQQPVCVVCRNSKTHKNHVFRAIDEAAQDYREELQKILKPLQEKCKLFTKEMTGKGILTEMHVIVQAENTEREIKLQFKKLHQVLEEEEEARISALRHEKEQKSLIMREKIEVVSREIAALSETFRATEEQLRAGDVSFLQNYKAAAERVQQRSFLDEPYSVSGALIYEAKHLALLPIRVALKMVCKNTLLDNSLVLGALIALFFYALFAVKK